MNAGAGPSPFEDLLAALGRAVGADLTPEERGFVALTFDGAEITLECPEGAPFVYLQGIARKVAPDRGADLEAAMRANLFGHPLSNAWLALDPETDDLRLCAALPLQGLDADRLGAQLEAFAAALTELRRPRRHEKPSDAPDVFATGFVRV